MSGICHETNNGYTEVTVGGLNLLQRRIFIRGDITPELADDFVSKLLLLVDNSGNDGLKPIDIIIDSPGGEVLSGLMIHDLIKSLEGKVEINLYCTRLAASIAAIIFGCGPKGHRFILPHSKVLIHEPLIAGGMNGSATEISKTAEEILGIKLQLNTLLSEATGKSLKQINMDTKSNYVLNAKSAIEYGLADEIRSPFEVI